METEKLNPASEATDAPELQAPEAPVPTEVIVAETQTPAEDKPVLITEAEKAKIIELISSNHPMVETPVAAATVADAATIAEPEILPESQQADELPVVAETPADAPVAEAVVPAAEAEPQAVAEAEAEAELPLTEEKKEVEVPQMAAVEELHLEVHDEEEDEDFSQHDFASLNKLQLVEMLEETVQEQDIILIKDKVAAIKSFFMKLNREDVERELEQFLSEGGERESFVRPEDPLELRYKAAFNKYKESKAKHNELLEKQKLENLAAKNAILEELKTLINSEETLKKTYDEFRVLQDKWRSIGQVPAGEITNLWNSYHFLVEKFFDKVKINRELRDLDMKKNMEAKIQLCEKVEELVFEESLVKAFKMLQKYHEEWKEIGPVPQDKKDEIWERFRTATDKINANRREYYARIQEVQQKNYDDKAALCVKAEELASEPAESISEWMKKTDEISELFKLWRQIGPAPKDVNDAVWKRFKAAMDNFFELKKEYFNRIKAQQLENLNRKRDLCIQAESLSESTEWRKTTEQLKALQEEWKKIGAVPRKDSDKIWKRFRTACDKFFARKSEFFGNMRGREEDNLKMKQELIEKVRNFEVSADRSVNLEGLKAIQRQWTEIGHVPMNVKDSIYAEFRKEIDKLFDRMKLTEQDKMQTRMRESVDSMREEADGPDRIRRERNQLNIKITKLRDEIKTLENNIGFFSSSKQSELMRQEYEKKINRAKNDLKVLETKLRTLADA
ncbi:MAG TPA: DUF349 domain-containing protein [Bacteroidales bacterium]|nr:DUF349 domain-containing protein [Bacteroidales bacterium]